MTMMSIEVTLGLLLAELAKVARDEGAELASGPPDVVAHAYLVGKVPTAFNVVVPARSQVTITIPLTSPSTRRGVALASAIGLLAGYQRCEAQVAARYDEWAAATKLAESLRQFVDGAGRAKAAGMATEFLDVRENAESLLQGLAQALGNVRPGLSLKAPAAREEALVYNVFRELAAAFDVDEILRLVDDGQEGKHRTKRARFKTRLEALKNWPGGYSEGFLVGSFGTGSDQASVDAKID